MLFGSFREGPSLYFWKLQIDTEGNKGVCVCVWGGEIYELKRMPDLELNHNRQFKSIFPPSERQSLHFYWSTYI